MRQLNLQQMYLELLKKCLLDSIYGSEVVAWGTVPKGSAASDHDIQNGTYWPKRAHTMIGMKRLNNIEHCICTVLQEGIPGDFMETGVWRGGATIFMAGLNKHYSAGRRVFVADSFEGLPPPDVKKWPQDSGDDHYTYPFLAVSEETVRGNFKRYDLLDDSVIFIKGFFEESIPKAPVGTLSVLRLDGDMYGSTMTVLQELYDRVSPGGFIIIDDWSILKCRAAVTDFLAERGLTPQIEKIDECGVFWRKV
jgi:O-methyltransferase